MIASQIAAERGLGANAEPLDPTQVNLDLMAAAEAERASQWETVLLLGHPKTVAAGRNWHEHAWRVEMYARGRITGSASDWQEVRNATDMARSTFYESARSDLGVSNGNLPGSEETRETRARRLGFGRSGGADE